MDDRSRGHPDLERLRPHRTPAPGAPCGQRLHLRADPDHGRSRVRRPQHVFREHYEYLPNAGDAGREYSYLVTAPYDALATLVAHLETEPGPGDLEERLARCFHERVRTADLHPGLGRQQARDLVTQWFTEAGVSATTDESHWFNTD